MTSTTTTGGIRVNNIAAITSFHCVGDPLVEIILLIPATAVLSEASLTISSGQRY